MTRHLQIVIRLALVGCSTAAGQESDTLTADAIVKAGETVNRDPARFPHPDSSILDAPTIITALSLSARTTAWEPPLARLEAQIASPALFVAFPDLRLATGEVGCHQKFVLRGLKAPPVSFSRATAEGTT